MPHVCEHPLQYKASGEVGLFLRNLKQVRMENNFSPHRIYYVDESGLSTVPTKLPNILSPTGTRCVAKIVSSERGINVTVVSYMNYLVLNNVWWYVAATQVATIYSAILHFSKDSGCCQSCYTGVHQAQTLLHGRVGGCHVKHSYCISHISSNTREAPPNRRCCYSLTTTCRMFR